MAKILVIKANPEGENCYTNRLVKNFMNEYLAVNPEDSITVKELDGIDFVKADREMLIYRASGLCDPEKECIYNSLSSLAEEFLEYDKYVLAFPNWNLLVPPSLVNYVLWVFRKKVIFDENGESKLKDKKCIAIYTSGGYTDTETNTSVGLEWIKLLLNKYKMGETYYLNAEGLERPDEEQKQNYQRYKAQVIELAKQF